MLKLLFLLVALFLNLFALCGNSANFDSCKQKVIDSKTVVNESLQIPIEKNQRLIFSQTPPTQKIIKYDPFLSLYLVEESYGFKYPFRFNSKFSGNRAVINDKVALKGEIVKHQIGVDSFAQYSQNLLNLGVVINGCCYLEAIVTPRGAIEKEYIQRFIDTKKVSYGDFGIKIKDTEKSVIVDESNPFLDGNLFKKGDLIVEFDGKKVTNSAALMRDILFSEVGSAHSAKVRRDGSELMLNMTTKNRESGGFVSEKPLEFFGISYDENLLVIKTDKEAEAHGVIVGDRLLQIEAQSVKTKEDIYKIFSGGKKTAILLFQRDDFQFFVNIN
ncbi:PDZ domain-containing protein [Sulfurimonas sp.]|uniref:DUF7488 domain-containing protein n=1 Tax=Sulfurimonas sp. TaxID=2022749 RepID=UPI0025DB3B02|nr:PDZ domain-containing protein [Sulfurimonas sp.]MDD5157840.1 PDZ domain-containing protein [Sulfurimonas sp.]